MAVTRKDTVIRIDADNDTLVGPLDICGIKYHAGTSAQIRSDQSSSGSILWENTGTLDVFEQVELHIGIEGIWVDLAGSAVIYLYCRR